MELIRRLLMLSVFAALLATTAACGDEAREERSEGGGSKTQTINIVMKDNVFEPKAITVSAGQEITFVVKNDGVNLHNMHVVSDDVEPKNAMNQPFEGGKSANLVVKFPKKGTYKFQCDLHVPDMAGTITVK